MPKHSPLRVLHTLMTVRCDTCGTTRRYTYHAGDWGSFEDFAFESLAEMGTHDCPPLRWSPRG